MKYLVFSFISFFIISIFNCVFYTPVVLASADNAFASIVNPVRGSDFWDLNHQKPVDAVLGELQILRQSNLTGTFLLRFDALNDASITQSLKNSPDEKGLFLEVTPSLTTSAGVTYHQSASWHNAASVLLTGYSLDDRQKLIDADFAEFKNIYGFYPKSVGAWWIGADSLSYMQEKYGVSNAMIVADQYSTDSYQIWGQYWGTPYYPAKNNALFPAQTLDNKIPIVITQWAARDPVNGYGTGVEESTYSVQANDYLDYHNLNTDYFSKLIDLYTQPERTGNQFGQLVVGLENSYDWSKYKNEYQNQINILRHKKNDSQIQVLTLNNFASWYQNRFPQLSPDQLIVATDPLGSKKTAVWYMNNFYRIGWIENNEGSVIRDLRQYVSGQDELCLIKSCNEVNFATFATRVLDEVTYGQKRVINEGKINNFQVNRQNREVELTYNNAADKSQLIQFLPRDIGVNGKTSSIDGFILDTIQGGILIQKSSSFNNDLSLKSSIEPQIFGFLIFTLFILIGGFLPGWVMTKKLLSKVDLVLEIFLSWSIGLVALTLTSFFSQILINDYWLVPFWILINLGLLIYWKLYKINWNFNLKKADLFLGILIILGTLFLTIPTFRNGLQYGYGIGFWGPNGHDGVWHLSLINQLQNSTPPQNPILAGTKLQNYHYFYDLLVAMVAKQSKIPAIDLLFRDFPLFFGLLLGLGTLSLLNFFNHQKNVLVSSLSLYLVYMTGSFGWIVDYIKNKSFNGESDFWANQAVSFNLNPPFMISLLLIIALIELLIIYQKSKRQILLLPIILLSGSLLEFKAYAAILVGSTLFVLIIWQLFKKKLFLIPVVVGMAILTLILLIPNYPSLSAIFQTGSGVFQFSPFWFIHSMIDSPDRLGLTRLSLTRTSGYESKNIIKIIYAEGLGLLLFIIGNLGIRTLGLFMLIKNRNWLEFNFQIVFTLVNLSILIPLFFIQKGTPWNTIQFFYYGLFFTAVLTAILLFQVFHSKITKIILIILIIILSPINCLVVAQGYLYPQPHTFISKQEFLGLKLLETQIPGVVLTYPYDRNLQQRIARPLPLLAYETTAYVSAFSKQPTFEEDEIQQDILNFSVQPEYIKRIVEEKDFFAGMEKNQARAFLNRNQIKYIYLPKIYGISLDVQGLGLKSIFENDQVIIYSVYKYD